jgi:cytochrome c peroxidase
MRKLPSIIVAMAALTWMFGLLTPSTGWGQDVPLGLPLVAIPADNPQSPEKIALGQTLFKDQRLSADGTISCAHCHHPERAYSDGLRVARGIREQEGTRNTPSILNSAYSATQFWDGRRKSLEEQANDPFVSLQEHGLDSTTKILDVIRKDAEYARQFSEVFGVAGEDVRMEHVFKSIAAFERSLASGDAPFDHYFYGGNKDALSEDAVRGLEFFRGRGKCAACHTIRTDGATFEDNQFHSLGIGYKRIEAQLATIAEYVAKANGKEIDEAVLSKSEVSELGRFVVTLKPTDIGRFKTPSLRNVAVTAPYMHDGSVKTLEEAVDLEVYYRSIEGHRPLILTPQEKADLVVFLKSLTSPQYAKAATSR